ncbi:MULTISPECIES: enoyl-CoA hydratase/isomerase family protein [Paraburkholderia]|uniref:enoyl-CoA hydratase/isomerase family protein n=1 Tax=Paraburkholderia TaxID=1822464 RepID=UPI002255A445|nr:MULTISPECIES: enoyl-CoA hydratase/isomerase family protein [Paraburkholderia]MCX4163631.1 enoyl-CoA hydratase/isomerase family protein [Paraburkholderia megapolitana]MDN7159126.1 enoyl-CoA hydratase/isomerase family protein [Paraburkholderia sp. CHISQ3]MDQ6496173.1 enoyl-CoA hydratase/isomerase family protein [Paraburkholderia megapolitana]
MKSIRFERDGSVGTIVLANPPYNRLDVRFAHWLEEAVHEASESDIRVLVVRAEGPNFSLGGEVREWPGKDANWFRTFVSKINSSYRSIEALRVPTVAVVQGGAFGGGFELALSCDFIVTAPDTVFRCVEVTTGMLPLAGALQRLAERVGRGRASRFAMLGEPILGVQAAELGIATHVAEPGSLEHVADELVRQLASGPTLSYATTRTLLKAWSSGGVAAADAVMLDVCIGLYDSEDATRGFRSTAAAFEADEVPPDMIFFGR